MGKADRVPLDETRPHTLADFVEEGAYFKVEVVGLPNEISGEDAFAVFGKMINIRLKPLPENTHYFGGGVYPEGIKVESIRGLHLFTIKLVKAEDEDNEHRLGTQLTVESAALELLKGNTQGGRK